MEASAYREYRPPEALSGLVECFWRREHGDGVEPSGAILPDGRVDLVWTRGEEVLVAGPQTRALARPVSAPFVAFGVRFHPGIGPALLGLPAHELLDAHVPLAALDTPAAGALGRELDPLEESDAALRQIGMAVLGLVEAEKGPDPLVRSAARLLEDPRATICDVAAEVALSERQLERRFREGVGYGPKMLQRVLRFQRLLRALDRGRESSGGLALIAASIGYADQAHLTREARTLSGLSPVQLERRRRA